MISAIVVSGCPVKHQQLEEPALTVKEKKQLLMEQYNTNPVDFLERYHTHLKPEHLVAFSHVSNDHKTQRYYTEVQKRAKRARKRRYAALRALEEGMYGDFELAHVILLKIQPLCSSLCVTISDSSIL